MPPPRRLAAGLGLVTLVLLASHPGHAVPPMGGTIFMSGNIITAADPTTYSGIAYAGTGPRLMFDRRVNGWVTYTAFLFNASYSDASQTIEVQVNPEFGTPAAAFAEAEPYARAIGQLPNVLRKDVRTVWIHRGTQPFGGGNNNLLIHTGQGQQYIAQGILEETLVHEAAHTSLDAQHANASGWVAAQNADAEFISTYARDFPTREDIAESVLPWLAVRHRRARLSASLAGTVEGTIPNRLQYFDLQAFNMFPLVPAGAAGAPVLAPAVVSGSTVTVIWSAPISAGALGFRLEAGSVSGAANLAVVDVAAAPLSATFGGVPSGTYFVRMRTITAAGPGAASNEIVVVVP